MIKDVVAQLQKRIERIKERRKQCSFGEFDHPFSLGVIQGLDEAIRDIEWDVAMEGMGNDSQKVVEKHKAK